MCGYQTIKVQCQKTFFFSDSNRANHVRLYKYFCITHLLHNLGGNRHHGVDGVRDDTDDSFGSMYCDALSQIPDDTSVYIEQVISGHTWLAGYSGGDDNHM